MIRYLDPKNDLTFRKIFGEHPHLLISLLNSLLPLEKGREIQSVEYLDTEIIPELPGFKRSMVDVRCKDNFDRIFIVEMQMYWTSSFKSRMLFNAGKVYIKQLKKGRQYKTLHPVYGLSLINDNFHNSEELKDKYYHRYRMQHYEISSEYIEGIELIFIELQKFKAIKYSEKKLTALWLRFLTEIDEDTQAVPPEFLEDNLINEALETVQESAFTEQELEYYEKYWDSIRLEEIALDDAKDELEKSETEKKALKQEKENAEQEKEKAITNLIKTVKLLKKTGADVDEIVSITGFTKDFILKL